MAAAETNSSDVHFSLNNVSIKQINQQKGKGLFANKDFREGEVIFEENPLVCSQFLWNSMYKYTACGGCLKSLETAEQMARRLSGNASLELPYASKCCEITRLGQKSISCHRCQVLMMTVDAQYMYSQSSLSRHSCKAPDTLGNFIRLSRRSAKIVKWARFRDADFRQ